MKTIFRGLFAFVAAIAVTSILSYGTDAILVAAGLMTATALPSSVALVALIIVYRSIYDVVGAFVLAKLAPSHPLRYGMVLGVLGTVGTLSAMVTMPDAGPAYYPIALAILTLPSVWLGVKLAERGK